ncbi:MAG: Gfo/Idh/MocA family oxidoreductase [Betaproteobacteria bacterium]|nr:Gfo/Idh/MocA family oxidoreductase [Betaproteobacteria bacterium]
MPNPLRAAVIGAGYLGKFHARKYAQLPGCTLAGVVDADPARAREIAAEHNTQAYTDFRELLDRIDVASIVVPTDAHFAVARACLEAGVHILVEKPVTRTLEEARTLVALAQDKGLVFQVGHLERFNPAIQAVREQIFQPLFIESERLAVFKPRGTDVNVVLDLMIHDIDLILSIVKSDVTEVRSSGFKVLTPAVDIATARIEFANGCVANVSSSRVSQQSVRKLRIFQPDSYLSIDCENFHVRSVRKAPGEAGDVIPRVQQEEQRFEKADPLLAEIESFLNAVTSETEPLVSGNDGRRALEVALKVCGQMNLSLNALGGTSEPFA